MAIAMDWRSGEGNPPPRPIGRVSVLFDDHETLVVLSGEIDLALVRELNEHVQDVTSRAAPVRVDVSGLTFIDSVGLGFIAQIGGPGMGSGLPLSVRGASRRIRQTIALAGIDSLLVYRD